MATDEEVSERIGDMTEEEIGDVLDALCSEWGVVSIRDGLVEVPVRAVAAALADAHRAGVMGLSTTFERELVQTSKMNQQGTKGS